MVSATIVSPLSAFFIMRSFLFFKLLRICFCLEDRLFLLVVVLGVLFSWSLQLHIYCWMAEEEESDMEGMEELALFGINGCCGISNRKGEALCINVS